MRNTLQKRKKTTHKCSGMKAIIADLRATKRVRLATTIIKMNAISEILIRKPVSFYS